MYIYADILLITNIYADFLLLCSAAALTHSPLKTCRAVLGAAAGSLFSLVIFLPRGIRLISLPLKLISSAAVVLIAFGYGDMRAFLRRSGVFFLCAFIFGGLGTAVSYITGGRFLYARNGVIYADFSFPALILSSAAAYLCIRIYRRIDGSADTEAVYTVIASDRGRTVSFRAVPDTGNLLRDSFTGKYVIVCPRDSLTELYGSIPDTSSEAPELSGKWRLIPVSTVSSKGLMAIIKPAEIILKNEETGRLTLADAYLGAPPSDCGKGIFNPKLLAY